MPKGSTLRHFPSDPPLGESTVLVHFQTILTIILQSSSHLFVVELVDACGCAWNTFTILKIAIWKGQTSIFFPINVKEGKLGIRGNTPAYKSHSAHKLRSIAVIVKNNSVQLLGQN